jgi:hypothetical protein
VAAGHSLPQFDHSDVAFGPVVVRRDPPVVGEAQVVVLAVDEPAGEGVVLFISLPVRAAVSLAPIPAADR